MSMIPSLPLNNVDNLVRFGASLRGQQTDHVWTPRNPFEAEAMVRHYQDDATPSSVFYDKTAWEREYQLLTRNVLRKDDYVVVHRNTNTLQLSGKIKIACCVTNMPSLSSLKAVIRREFPNSSYDMWNSPRKNKETVNRERVHVDVPNPTIWAVNAAHDSNIFVCDALTGVPLWWLRDCKLNVGITAISHAPFLGFINKQLQVIPVSHPFDLLPLKEHHLVEADYVWVGFADGAVRLFPANHEHFRESERADDLSKGEIADVVFEVPKCHAGAIISIIRSPSLEEEEGIDLTTSTRLSSTMKQLRNSATAALSDSSSNRKHLSLVCTASVDSVVVVWDIKKIYQTLQQMRETQRKERQKNTISSSAISHDVISVEHCNPLKGTKATSMSKITCVMVKLRPLLRLKGGVPGLTCLRWISSLVTTEGYKEERDPVKLTRASVEESAPEVVRCRREVQIATRFERREEQRRALELNEEEMCDVEKELRTMIPPLALEKPQSVRINLLIAGDSVGTVHVWNLDEELERKTTSELECGSSLQATKIPPKRNVTASKNETQSSPKARPKVQTTAVHPPSHGSVAKTTGLDKKMPTGYVKPTAPPPIKGPSPSSKGTAVVVPPVNLSRIEFQSPPSSARLVTPRMSKLQLLAAQRQGNVPRKVHPCDPVVAPKAPARRRNMIETRGRLEASNDPVPRRHSSAKKETTIQNRSRKEEVPPLNPISFSTPAKESRSRQTASAGPMTPSPQASRSARKITTTTVRHAERSEKVGGSVSPQSPSLAQSRSPARLSYSPGFETPHASRIAKEIGSPRSPAKAKGIQESPVPTGRAGTLRLSAREASRVSPSPRMPSTSKSLSRSSQATKGVNQILSRSAKCRIEFTGGVAVTGMAAQLPKKILVTMRRIPDPVERERSLLEDPVPEEVEKRVLENSFNDLDDEKALFFVFQYLQLYLSVEGALVNFRFSPEWTAKDSDGRDLFMHRDYSFVNNKFRHEEEVPLDRDLALPSFHLRIKKLVLDAHSQPVCSLYLDRQRQQLWAGRNDGLLSIFSTESKFLVTRIPHPSASEALGPPDPEVWTRQLQQYLHDSNFMTATRRLHKHQETLSYDAARFSGFIPICRTLQKSFAVLYQQGTSPQEDLFFCSRRMEICHLDGRANLSANDRKHERHLNVFLNYLKMCRGNANSVRKAQREFYLVKEKSVNQHLTRMGTCTEGVFAGLVSLRNAFHLWRRHKELFGHEHLARHQKEARKKVLVYSAEILLQINQRVRLRSFFSKWRYWVLLERASFPLRCVSNMIRLSHKRMRRPTTKMMEHLASLTIQKQIFREWKQTVHTKQFAVSAVPVITPRGEKHIANILAFSHVTREEDQPTSLFELDSEAKAFLRCMLLLYRSRFYILQFSDALLESAVEDSWMPVLENAESAALTDDVDGRKTAVLCYGLIPILQGFLSSSDNILANLHDKTIMEDVLSMMHGMLLCLDYILGDPEETLAELLAEGKLPSSAVGDTPCDPLYPLLFGSEKAFQGIIHYYLENILLDDESAVSISEIAKETENLDTLLSYIQTHSSPRLS